MKYKPASILVGIFALFLIVFINVSSVSAVMIPVNITNSTTGNITESQIWFNVYSNGTANVYLLNSSYNQTILNSTIDELIKKQITNMSCVGINGSNSSNCYINISYVNQQSYVLIYSNSSMGNLSAYLANFFYNRTELDTIFVKMIDFQNHVNENVNSINGLSALSGRVTTLDNQMIALNQSDILYKSETSDVGLWIVSILALVVGIIAIYLNLAGGGGGGGY